MLADRDNGIPLYSSSAAGLILSPYANRATPVMSVSSGDEISVDTGVLEEQLPQSIEGIFVVAGAGCAANGHGRCFDKDYARTIHRLFLQYVGKSAGLDEFNFPLLQLDRADWSAPFSAPFSLSGAHPYIPSDEA